MNWRRLLRSILVLSWLASFLAFGVAAQSANPESKVTLKNPPPPPHEPVKSNGTSWYYELRVELKVANVVCFQPANTQVEVVLVGVIDPLGSAERNATHTENATPKSLVFQIPTGEYLQQPYVAELATTLFVGINETEDRMFTIQVHLSATRYLAAILGCYGTTETVNGHNDHMAFVVVLNEAFDPGSSAPAGKSNGLAGLGSLVGTSVAFWWRRIQDSG